MKQLKRIKRIFALALALAVAISIAVPESVFAAEPAASDPSADTVWLHVINGNFSGSYDGKEIASEASVEVTLDEGRVLPESVSYITANRTHGDFDGWYTKAASEVLQPQEDGAYSVWHTEKKNGTLIKPGSKVPEDVNVLYAVFEDSKGIAESDKLVEYYLDWNGIDGRSGHCLTCIRSYDEGRVSFTPKDAAVFGLNYSADYDSQFVGKESWDALKTIWEGNQFNGYTFKGWSDAPHGNTIWSDYTIENGMSFYAQWEKDGDSSDTFEPGEDPDAGPLDFIRIAGAGLDSSLSLSRHAATDAAITLTILRGPIHAQVNDVVWTLTVGTGMMKTETFTVNADSTVDLADGGLEAKAEGCNLTITDKDGKEYGIIVDVSAKGSGEDSEWIAAPAKANVGFVHTWDQGTPKGVATCEEGTTISYKCTTCNATKEVKCSPLGHVYEKNMKNSSRYELIKEPTCTEAGEIQYKCIRCGKINEEKVKVPALGHDWKITNETPFSCNQNQVTRVCQRDNCGATETIYVSASNPDLHKWTEYDRYHNTCMSDTVYERCTVCNQTRHYAEPANNPDRHAFAYESRMRVNCEQVMYTFRCVHGCGSTEVKLSKEVEHVWSSWKTVKAPTTTATGELARTCSRCNTKETKVIPKIAVAAKPAAPKVNTATTAKVNTSTAVKANTAAAATVKTTGWQTIGGKKYYYSAKGVKQKNGIKTIGGKKYYFDKNGVMKTGWQKIGKKKYYFDKNGVMKTGWQKIGKKKYYFGKNGVMKTGWQKIKGKKYYFDKKGVMVTGKKKIGKKTYTFKSNGVLKK